MQLAGGWVRSRRDLQNLRGTELARRAGIHSSVLWRLEGGSTPFTIPYVVQVADGLGVSREELVVRAVYDFAKREPCKGVRGEGTPHLHSGRHVRAQRPGHAPERLSTPHPAPDSAPADRAAIPTTSPTAPA
ncbi:helix-turn-helix domain-containing protein [Amycolatopsis stemonae]